MRVSFKEANQRRLAKMTEAELRDVLDRSAAFAARLVRARTWRSREGGVLPEGRSIQDVVQLAFEKILEGAKWDEDKALWLVLEGLIRGWVGNWVKSWENRRFSNADDTASPEGDDAWVSAVDQFEASAPTAAQELLRKEDDDLILEIISSMEEGSPERRVIEAIFSGASKRAEIMADAGLDAGSYEAVKKRLQRFLENYRQDRASAHH